MKIDIKGTIVSDDDAWIYDYFGISVTSPKYVRDLIDKAAGEDLDVEINSGGGDLFSGTEIYSLLRQYPGNVNIHIISLCASAASVIMCAGHSDITPASQVMIHNVWSYTEGDHNDMTHMADMLNTADRAVAAAYEEKTGMKISDLLELMEKETWLTADDAVEYGFVDEIAKPAAKEPQRARMAASLCEMLPESMLKKMQAKKMEIQLALLELDKK